MCASVFVWQRNIFDGFFVFGHGINQGKHMPGWDLWRLISWILEVWVMGYCEHRGNGWFFFFLLLTWQCTSIYHLTAMTILTQDQKFRDQTNINKKLETKLRFDIKNRDQFCNLLKKERQNYPLFLFNLCLLSFWFFVL